MIFLIEVNEPITACKQYCLAAGVTHGKNACTKTGCYNLSGNQ
jgi:hypothetical protein